MEYSTLILHIFYLTTFATALYTEVRKLSGNEYRDNYRLPLSSSNSSISIHGKKTLFKWNAVGNYSVLTMRKPSNWNKTRTLSKKKNIKKERSKLMKNQTNLTETIKNHQIISKRHRKKRLKRKRDGLKKINKKKEKIKRGKNKKNKSERKHSNEIIKSLKTMNASNYQNTVQRYMTDLTIDSLRDNSTLAEEPRRSDTQIGNIHSNEIAQFHYHIPFRLKWQALAERNFTSDHNECLFNNGGCEGLCINTPGSYRCHCPQGFHLDINRKLCIDINECASRNGHGPCQGECTNTWGSYKCGCKTIQGTLLADDNKSCKIINACSVHKCSHQCINTRSGAFCTCPQGYILNDDWLTCQDIDECKSVDQQDKICNEKICKNTVGSYKCI